MAERFSKWVGQIFGSQKWRVSAGRCACAMQGDVWGGMCPLRSWSFFENVSSNETIWCTIFHHVKHLTACLFRCFFFVLNFRTGWSKKVGGMSEKWRGHWPPCPPPPGSAAYGWRGYQWHTNFEGVTGGTRSSKKLASSVRQGLEGMVCSKLFLTS